MPSDNANQEEHPAQLDRPARGVPDPAEPRLEGVLTAEDIREIEASGITLSDVIREIEAEIAAVAERDRA